MIENVCKRISEYLPNFPIVSSPLDLMKSFCEWNGSINLDRKKVDGLDNAEVYAGKDVIIQPYTLFSGKVIICNGARIGPYNFIRGPVFIGPNVMIGPSCEVIRTIVMDRTTLSHKNLVGDAIFGEDVSFAGSSAVCNYPFGREHINVRYNDKETLIPGEKFGAVIGNRVKCGYLTLVMPGCHIPDDTQLIGQCVVSGKCKVKSFVKSSISQ